jgi:guanylate kinase
MILDCTGMMIIISSPSGAGKTTLVKLLSKRNKNFEISISNTTRVPRRDEIEGKDYYFIDEEKFNDLIKTKSFYEYARVFNNFYGTLKNPVIKHLSHGKDVLFDIDWNGSKQMKELKLKNKLISIFILPPNIKTLRDRLSNRDMKDKLILKERMNQFKNDVLHWKEYDYIVINNDLEKCYEVIMSIIDCEKKGKKFLFDQSKIKEKISELIS